MPDIEKMLPLQIKVDLTPFYRYLETFHNAKYNPDIRIPSDLEYLVELADIMEDQYIEEDEK